MKMFIFIVFVCLFAFAMLSLSSNNKNDGSGYDKKVYNNSLDYDSEEEYLYNDTGYSYIDSYVRSDGTTVSGHYRTDPDEYEENNFSYKDEETSDWNYEY